MNRTQELLPYTRMNDVSFDGLASDILRVKSLAGVAVQLECVAHPSTPNVRIEAKIQVRTSADMGWIDKEGTGIVITGTADYVWDIPSESCNSLRVVFSYIEGDVIVRLMSNIKRV